MDHTFNVSSSVLSYVAGFGAVLLAHQSDIVSALGIILLLARLIYDVPKAYKTITDIFRKKE